MSNGFAMLQASGDANLTTDKAVIRCGEIDNCIIVDINRTTNEDILQMRTGDAMGDNLCLALQDIIHIENYPIKLRGTDVQQ
jgi:hypothetical protein